MATAFNKLPGLYCALVTGWGLCPGSQMISLTRLQRSNLPSIVLVKAVTCQRKELKPEILHTALNLSTDADSSTDTKTNRNEQKGH